MSPEFLISSSQWDLHLIRRNGRETLGRRSFDALKLQALGHREEITKAETFRARQKIPRNLSGYTAEKDARKYRGVLVAIKAYFVADATVGFNRNEGCPFDFEGSCERADVISSGAIGAPGAPGAIDAQVSSL